MKKTEGYVLIDSILGLFCLMALVSVVHGLYSVRSAFDYDPRCPEMRELWENGAYTKIYVPQKITQQEEPAEPALP